MERWLGLLIAASLLVATAPTGTAADPPQATDDVHLVYQPDVVYENQTLEIRWDLAVVQADTQVRANGTLVQGSLEVQADGSSSPVDPALWLALGDQDGEEAPSKWIDLALQTQGPDTTNPCVQIYPEGIPPVFVDPACLPDELLDQADILS